MNPLVTLFVSALCMIFGVVSACAFTDNAEPGVQLAAGVMWLAAITTFIGNLIYLLLIASKHL